MNSQEVAAALEDYVTELDAIRSRFKHTRSGIDMNIDDEPRYRQIVQEIADLLSDTMQNGPIIRSAFARTVNDGVGGVPNMPSLHGVQSVIANIRSTITRIKRNPSIVQLAPSPASPDKHSDLEHLIRRLPLIIEQMAERQRSRSPFEVNDEYDLQDLFHGLLNALFDDIRPEEHTPSYASSSSRMDFFLPEIGAVTELKMMRPSMSTRDLADQLINDIFRYQVFPGCKTLYCVVYDPDGRISNPRGVEADLMRPVNQIDVKVIIVR